MKYAGRSSQLWFAVVLIVLGVIFLVQNYTGLELGNWWALFSLIPASAALAAAWAAWRSGLHPAAVSSPLVGGIRQPRVMSRVRSRQKAIATKSTV